MGDSPNWAGTAPTLTLGADYTINGLIFDDMGAGADVALTMNGPLASATAWTKLGGSTLTFLYNTLLTDATTIATSANTTTGGTLALGSATVGRGTKNPRKSGGTMCCVAA